MADFSLTSGVSTARRNVKRNIDDFEADGLGLSVETPSSKRTALPFRTSPKLARRPSPGDRTTSFMTFQTQTPTPVESSEDEMCDADDLEISAAPDHVQIDVYPAGKSSTSVIKADAGNEALLHPNSMDSVSYDPAMPPPRTLVPNGGLPRRNARGLSLSQNPFNAQAQQQMPTDRTPTPISSSFPRSSSLRLPLIRTALTPPMGGHTPDTAVRPCLPSPSNEDYDMDTSMSPTLAPTDQMMNGLRIGYAASETMGSEGVPVSPSDNVGSVWQRRAAQGLESQAHAPQWTASPRLHMGYRADCEKCRSGVPGHYNHVLWS